MGWKLYVFCFLTNKETDKSQKELVKRVVEATIQSRLANVGLKIEAFISDLHAEEAKEITISPEEAQRILEYIEQRSSDSDENTTIRIIT